ncbi:MAG: hypothetical protein IBJ09_02090 [Bacteroidia bacterium]|nr:hypothetical protein [Bacteroidia bacterium]
MRKNFVYILGMAGLFCLGGCDKADTQKAEKAPAAKDADMQVVLLKHDAETLCYMQVTQSGDNATIKWKLQPIGTEDAPTNVMVIDDNVQIVEADEITTVTLDPAASYYFIPAANPASPVKLAAGSGNITVKCNCILKTDPTAKCAENSSTNEDIGTITCVADEECLECKPQVDDDKKKIISSGSGLLIKANSVYVYPL